MEKKYRLTEETMEWCGHTLHRIEALMDFGDVKTGDKGGWVEREENLNHDGDAWVSGNARVYGNADYIIFKNWWSSGRYFTWTRSNNKWKVGCFTEQARNSSRKPMPTARRAAGSMSVLSSMLRASWQMRKRTKNNGTQRSAPLRRGKK